MTVNGGQFPDRRGRDLRQSKLLPLMDAENNLGVICKQRSSNENGEKGLLKRSAISLTHNEEEKLLSVDTHTTYERQEGYRINVK